MKNKIIALVILLLAAPSAAEEKEEIPACRTKGEIYAIYGYIAVDDVDNAVRVMRKYIAENRCAMIDLNHPTVYYIGNDWAIVESSGEPYWLSVSGMHSKYINKLKRGLVKGRK